MTRRVLVTAAVLTSILVCSAFLGQPPSPALASSDEIAGASVTKAKALIDAHQGETDLLLQAQSMLLNIVNADPSNAAAYVQLARAEYKLGYMNYRNYSKVSLGKALAYVSRALEIDPRLFEGHLIRGYVYLFDKNLPEARKSAQEASQTSPGAPETDLLLADIARGEKNDDEALTLAEGVVQRTKDPKLLRDAYGILGPILWHKKEWEAAEKIYLARIALEPSSAWARTNYASFLISKGDYDKAIESAEKGLEFMEFGMGHRVLARAYYWKGADLLWKQKDYQNCGRYFELALEQNPKDAEAHYGLGNCFRAKAMLNLDPEMLEKSRDAFAQAVRLDPKHEKAKSQLDNHPQFVEKLKKQ
ncbi:MAG: tetratricopeptide repeat protein [Thermodesulfobacteriota bacterium]